MSQVWLKSKEKDNFARIMMVLAGKGTKCVRIVFDREFHPDTLKTTLSRNRYQLSKAKINSTMWKILYPPPDEPVKSKSFDITVMTCLLNKLTPMRIEDGLPLKSNIEEEADIARLKWYRNTVSHLQPPKIDDQTFVEWSTAILQVIGRLGYPGWVEKCKSLLEGSLDENMNDVKSLLGQLYIILHNKGCDISRKVSEIYGSFSPIDQLRFILTLLEEHFWMFPPIHEVWNDLQDSHDGNFDEKPFQRCNCSFSTANETMRIERLRTIEVTCEVVNNLLDRHDRNFDKNPCQRLNCSSVAVNGTLGMEGLHTIEIECENCPYNLEKDSETTAVKKPNNVIKITCACREGTGEHCYMTLLEKLDTRLYRHVSDMSDNSYHQMFLTMKSCKDKDEDTVNGRKKIALIDFTTNSTIPGAETDCTHIPFFLNQDALPGVGLLN